MHATLTPRRLSLLARFKLWTLEKKITRAEEYEQELVTTLYYMRTKMLPQLRGRRNEILYPPKAHR